MERKGMEKMVEKYYEFGTVILSCEVIVQYLFAEIGCSVVSYVLK